jgi:hypothetical protein
MTEFSKELGEELRDCLQRETTWWPDVKKHPDLAIAVRNKYLNVYSNGQSIFKVGTRSGNLWAETHYKYLLSQATPEYRSFRNNKFSTDGLSYIKDYQGPKTLNQLIGNANVYAGDEKKNVHAIIRSPANSNVIDLEVSFTTQLKSGQGGPEAEIEAEKETEKTGIDRIDIVALESKSENLISIVFYEVKTFNDPRLRAEKNAEVIGQLNDYERAICGAGDENIKKAYHQVCCDLVCLDRPVGNPGQISPLIRKAAKDLDIIEVDNKPRLIIVDYERDQWEGRVWQNHLKKLTDEVGINRVIGWGEAGRVKIGPDRLVGGKRYNEVRQRSA